MRYRRSSYRYAMVIRSGHAQPLGHRWPSDPVSLLLQNRWVPDSDTYETARSVEIVVDLAGVDEDDFEVHLFEDAVLVEGHRRLPAPHEEAVYHAAAIRRGPFRLEVALPAPVDSERVEARYERGLLRITLPKRG
jgi:HSP20 family protein